jgi:hypothetical protein
LSSGRFVGRILGIDAGNRDHHAFFAEKVEAEMLCRFAATKPLANGWAPLVGADLVVASLNDPQRFVLVQ